MGEKPPSPPLNCRSLGGEKTTSSATGPSTQNVELGGDFGDWWDEEWEEVGQKRRRGAGRGEDWNYQALDEETSGESDEDQGSGGIVTCWDI